MKSYITIKKHSIFEYEDRKSRFIAEAVPVESDKEALDFIEEMKKKYPDANHHVYAYVIRNNSVMRFSDDREPQGTAGMPVLDIIRKNSCTNVAIVVVRYFGGTLLGTGGLVHAYSASALGALQMGEMVTYDIYSEYSVECSYSDYQKMNPLFESVGFVVENTEYREAVTVLGKIRSLDALSFEEKLIQTTSGRVVFEKISEKYDFS